MLYFSAHIQYQIEGTCHNETIQHGTVKDILKLYKPDWWLTTVGIISMVLVGVMLSIVYRLFGETAKVSNQIHSQS